MPRTVSFSKEQIFPSYDSGRGLAASPNHEGKLIFSYTFWLCSCVVFSSVFPPVNA